MRIGIDISSIVYGTGVSVYTKKLVENLFAIDKDNEYILFGGSLRRSQEIKDFIATFKGQTFKGKVLPIPPTIADFMWNKLHVLQIENLVGKVDVYHTSDWVEPPANTKKVTTIHDFTPILYPQYTDPKIVSVHRRRLEWVKKESDKIIVPSQSTARDTIKYGIEESRIRIIPESYSFNKMSEQVVGKIKEKYGIKRNYFLSIGVNRRKNTYRIVKAFMKIQNELNYDLVIVGNPAIKFPPNSGVIFTNHISDNDLQALLSGTEALIYPSFYEGFGLPILEAFNLGVPVLTSDVGSMAEISENAAVLVDPNSVESILQAMKSVVENKKALIKKGNDVVKKYSWTKTAHMTLDVYNELKK